MNAIFQDQEDAANPANGRALSSVEAIQLLRSLQVRAPFFCSFVSEHGTLLVGVSPRVGCTQFTPPNGGPPYMMAMMDPTTTGDDYVHFLSGGTPSAVPHRYSIPWNSVESIIVQFVDDGVVSRDVDWEEI